MSIAVIAGLGNPGIKYHNTRHNIGFNIINFFARSYGVKWKHNKFFDAQVADLHFTSQRLLLIKPMTFMNNSGYSLKSALNHLNLSQKSLLVVYDDISLKLGRIKLSLSGGSGGHNGINDVFMHIGEDFARYRVGIGPKPKKNMVLADYVLSQFTNSEQEQLSACLPENMNHLLLILNQGPLEAMKTINQTNYTLNERND